MYDAIVIGARCAGSPTAMLLARRGHRVLLIDRAKFPSDTVSTHLVKPRGMAYLRKWGVLEQLRAAGTQIRRQFCFTREAIGLTGAPDPAALGRCLQREHAWDDDDLRDLPVEWACIRRRVLDKILVDAAGSAGVEIREGLIVEDLLTDATGRVVGVRGRTEQGTRVEERARVVIGADGRHSLVARSTKAPVISARPRCTFTVYSYFSGVDVDAFRPPVHLRGRLGVGFAPTHAGLALVSVWGPREWFDRFRPDLEENLLRTIGYCYPQLEDAVRSTGRREHRFAGSLDQANVLRQGSGPGWLLVGDAGCHVDQCTAIGITLAFRDAELAAAAVHDGLAGAITMDAALAAYEERRLADLRPQFEYVSTVAECNPPTLEQLQLLAALRERPADAARFLGFGAAIVPRSEYFSPAELAHLTESARDLPGVPAASGLAEMHRRHAIAPWS